MNLYKRPYLAEKSESRQILLLSRLASKSRCGVLGTYRPVFQNWMPSQTSPLASEEPVW